MYRRNPLVIVLIVLLVLMLFASPLAHVAPAGMGWYGSGFLGLIFVIVLVLLLTGYL